MIFKLIIKENGEVKELDNEFDNQRDAEIYAEEILEVEAYRVMPFNVSE